MVQRLAYGSPTPLIWVRILVPVQINLKIRQFENVSILKEASFLYWLILAFSNYMYYEQIIGLFKRLLQRVG